ncbi:MAG: acetyl-CoA carboxylase carboxyltransferase subunit alpha [Nitrospirae bacterium]|nr:MAG: acetyl-CoA carboxylase carboxyltransferase subunit alpha [Nitrospirota bacterium]
MRFYLDFEKPIQELDLRIEELKRLSNGREPSEGTELAMLQEKTSRMLKEIFSSLTPWQRTQVARHPDRPYTLDYINLITDDFVELHGDRCFGDDSAIVGGLCSVDGETFVVVGHQKGRGTRERIERNFGQPHPEGYRKAIRLMKLAEQFKKPVLTFIDTPGAFPGVGAEERGQAGAIATSLMEMSSLKTPIISIVIGEGGSGGALALSVADKLYMLENAIYSVISPEGCAAILWKKNGTVGTEEYARAAEALKLTAHDLKNMGIIDDVIPEPPGGAHRSPEETADEIKKAVLLALDHLRSIPVDELINLRYEKLRKIGALHTGEKAT